MKRKLTICLISNIESIHFIKDIDNIFRGINYNFHIIDVLSVGADVAQRPIGPNLIYHLIPSHVKSRARYFLNFFKIKSVMKKIQPDIIHCYGVGLYGLLGLFLGFHPLIVTVHGSEIYRSKSKKFFYKNFMDRILKNADIITYASDGMKNFLIDYFGLSPKKLEKIYRGIDPKIFYIISDSCRSGLRGRLEINEEDMVFFSSRRILSLYNISTIVEAFYEINKIFNNTRLILVKGDVADTSPYYLEIKNSIRQGIKAQNIILIDEFVEQKKMAELYNISNFFISIPETDELSTSIFEGMACNSLPIITNLGAYEELKDKCEMLFINNGRDAGELAQKMIYAIENYHKTRNRINDKNCAYVLDHVIFENVKKNIFEMYNSVLQNYETNFS